MLTKDWKLATQKQQETVLKKMFGTLYWSKHGGYARSRLASLEEKLKVNKFKQVERSRHGSADGSYMGSGCYYTDRYGNVAILSSNYGSHRYDNSYHFSVYAAKSQDALRIIAEIKGAKK